MVAAPVFATPDSYMVRLTDTGFRRPYLATILFPV